MDNMVFASALGLTESFVLTIFTDSSEDRIQRETTAEAEWTAEEERALVRKLDLRVLFPCCFIYFLAYVDRGNLYVCPCS
jgi:hypothetical protein